MPFVCFVLEIIVSEHGFMAILPTGPGAGLLTALLVLMIVTLVSAVEVSAAACVKGLRSSGRRPLCEPVPVSDAPGPHPPPTPPLSALG